MIKKLLSILTPKKHIAIYNIAFAIIYTLIFRAIYKDYLADVWGYMGYEVNNTNTFDIILADILCVLPILFYKAKKTISDFISIILYIMVHVPSIIAYQYYFDFAKAIGYEIVFTLAMVLFFRASSSATSKKTYLKKTNIIPFYYYKYFGVLIIVFLLVAYRGNLHLVSFSDVYDLRSDNSAVSAGNPLVGYIQLWAANVFAPLFISYGLLKKNRAEIIFGCTFSLIVYMATGLKGAIFVPIVVFLFYYILSKNKTDSLVYLFPIITIACLIIFVVGDSGSENILFSIIYMRTFGIASLNVAAYTEVFSNVPYTYYSHIGIVNKITGMYPFKDPSLGTAVYETFLGREGVANANANFLITDGVAACGILGVIIVSLVFYVLLVYLNRLSNNHNLNFVLSFFSAIIMALTNVSLFTTIISCGLFIAIIILRYSDLENNEKDIYQSKIFINRTHSSHTMKCEKN